MQRLTPNSWSRRRGGALFAYPASSARRASPRVLGLASMNAKDYSGEVRCDGEVIAYHSALGDWSVRISDVRLIGEYTNSYGPYLDDYFLVFLTAPENGWHEASFYAKGRDEALAAPRAVAHRSTAMKAATRYCQMD